MCLRGHCTFGGEFCAKNATVSVEGRFGKAGRSFAHHFSLVSATPQQQRDAPSPIRVGNGLRESPYQRWYPCWLRSRALAPRAGDTQLCATRGPRAPTRKRLITCTRILSLLAFDVASMGTANCSWIRHERANERWASASPRSEKNTRLTKR